MNHRWKLWGTAALIGVAALSFTGCSDRTGANLGRAIDGNSRGTYFEENTVETLTTIIERYQAQDTWTKTPVFSREGFDLIQDIMRESGELTMEVPYDGFVQTSFAEKAVAEISPAS